MWAGVLTATRRVAHRAVPVPEVGSSELLVRVAHTGICGSDLATFRGTHPYKRPPIVLGHELSGIVEQVGSAVRGFGPGDRVTAAAFSPCERCPECRRDAVNLCQNRLNLSHRGWQGSFAERVSLHPNMTFRLPDPVDLRAGALVEPLAIGLHALRRVHGVAGRKVVVLGCGGIGLGCVLLARRLGCAEVNCVDLGEAKGELVARLSADRYVDAARVSVREAFASDMADVTVVATGYRGVLDDALAVTRPGGKVVVVSYFDDAHRVDLNAWVAREVALDFSALAVPDDFTTVLGWLADGTLSPLGMITHRFPLADVGEAFELFDGGPGTAGKVMLDVSEETVGG